MTCLAFLASEHVTCLAFLAVEHVTCLAILAVEHVTCLAILAVEHVMCLAHPAARDKHNQTFGCRLVTVAVLMARFSLLSHATCVITTQLRQLIFEVARLIAAQSCFISLRRRRVSFSSPVYWQNWQDFLAERDDNPQRDLRVGCDDVLSRFSDFSFLH